jgi:hypothetical protein
LSKLTAAQRVILAEAGRAYGDASWAMVNAAVALSHDADLRERFTPSLTPGDRADNPDGEFWDLEEVREMLERLGNEMTAAAFT